MSRDTVKLEPRECETSSGPAFLVPVNAASVPSSLVSFLCRCFNVEVVDAADTYPHDQHFDEEEFRQYWFGYTTIVLLQESPELHEERDWETVLLGTYYIKPNYMGHCAHICNAGFIVPTAKQSKKYGKVLARSFPYFAAQLKYRSSVFNLVFESNKASMALWDRYGYKRVGRIEDAIQIRGEYIAAIVYQGNFLDGSVDVRWPW